MKSSEDTFFCVIWGHRDERQDVRWWEVDSVESRCERESSEEEQDETIGVLR